MKNSFFRTILGDKPPSEMGLTYSHEHIIIDDCSTDNSVKVIENWIKENDYECTFIKHEVNQGICKTLNESIKLPGTFHLFLP